jgi:hypothetical protein
MGIELLYDLIPAPTHDDPARAGSGHSSIDIGNNAVRLCMTGFSVCTSAPHGTSAVRGYRKAPWGSGPMSTGGMWEDGQAHSRTWRRSKAIRFRPSVYLCVTNIVYFVDGTCVMVCVTWVVMRSARRRTAWTPRRGAWREDDAGAHEGGAPCSIT